MLDRLRKPSAMSVLLRGLRRSRRALPRRLPVRRLGRLLGFVVVAVVGAWLGLQVGGHEATPVGPVNTHLSAHFAWTGGTEIRVGPLGTLSLNTHRGPIGITATVDQLNVSDARNLVDDPNAFDGLESWVSADARDAIKHLVIRSAISALVGSLVLSVVVYRRRARRVAAVFATAVALVGASLGTAAATWNPRAISQPKYTGLLVSAPSVVGNAQDIVSGFSGYGRSLAKLVGNVSKLYDVTSTLPTYEPDPSTIRVLQVADIHLNPAAWQVIKSISEQFKVNLIVDSGDITDHGSKAESRFVDSIKDLGVPYVYVRGNHDSQANADEVARQPNGIVLDHGETREIDGLKITGDGDPRFTPDRSSAPPTEEDLEHLGDQVAAQVRVSGSKPDIAVVHDPSQGLGFDGVVPLILAGHVHHRSTKLLPGGTRLFIQGTTGGAGLRALEGETPQPVECSVLYFDAKTKRLQAWDDVTLGGLGLTSAEINRSLAPEAAKPFQQSTRQADPWQGP